MKLVIDIPEAMIEAAKTDMWCSSPTLGYAIKHGTPYEERPRGEWTEEFDESANPFFQRRWRCSACNDYNYYGRPDFCPWCGADMSKEGEKK